MSRPYNYNQIAFNKFGKGMRNFPGGMGTLDSPTGLVFDATDPSSNPDVFSVTQTPFTLISPTTNTNWINSDGSGVNSSTSVPIASPSSITNMFSNPIIWIGIGAMVLILSNSGRR